MNIENYIKSLVRESIKNKTSEELNAENQKKKEEKDAYDKDAKLKELKDKRHELKMKDSEDEDEIKRLDKQIQDRERELRNNLKESIKPLVMEAFQESFIAEKGKTKGKIKVGDLVKKLMQNPEFKEKAMKYLSDEDAYDGWSDALKGKKYDTLDNVSDGSKRRIVTQKLKDEKYDYAPMAYKLWPQMSDDAARSWFSKKVAGKNASFTDEEISALFSMLNNTVTS